jgi:hypothetical protein
MGHRLLIALDFFNRDDDGHTADTSSYILAASRRCKIVGKFISIFFGFGSSLAKVGLDYRIAGPAIRVSFLAFTLCNPLRCILPRASSDPANSTLNTKWVLSSIPGVLVVHLFFALETPTSSSTQSLTTTTIRFMERSPLDVVLNNLTRWPSTLYMIRVALELRFFLEDRIERVTLEFNIECHKGIKRKGEIPLCLCEESLLSEKDWKVTELMDKLLVDFEKALLMLEGDAQSRVRKAGRIKPYGNMWDVASTYEFLMDSLEEWKAVMENYPDPEHFKVKINLGWVR